MSEVQEAPQVQPKVAQNVVTNENMAEFVANKLGLAGEAAEPPQSEPASTGEAEAVEDRKQNPKLEKRFSEITKQREAARQEAQREREAREAAETKLREYEAKVKPVETVAEQEPAPEQFSDMFEYAKALTDYKVDQRMAEERLKQQTSKLQAEREKVLDTWSQRVVEAKKEMPDFEDMVGSADVVVSNEVRDAIFESDVGPRILYHLAENPDIAEKLQGMTLTRALATIGKLEAQFEAPQTKPAVVKSKAPAPINPIKASANGPITDLDSNRQFHGNYQAWKAARLAGRIK